MPKAIRLLTIGTALLAAPALAQLAPAGVAPDGAANVNLVGQVGLNPAATTDAVTAPVDDTVDQIDDSVNETVDTANMTLATREQVRAGAEIHNSRGNSVGTVQSIEGDTAVVIRGGKLYNVPLAEVYHGAVGAAHGLVTPLSSAEITARADAAVDAR